MTLLNTDFHAAAEAGLVPDLDGAVRAPTLNRVMAFSLAQRRSLREAISSLLLEGAPQRAKAENLTLDEAEATPLPPDWPDHLKALHRQSPADLVEAFETEGWDVTDKRRKPLRMLPILALPLALAARGVAGQLPFAAEPDHPTTDWGASLKAEAGRFRKR